MPLVVSRPCKKWPLLLAALAVWAGAARSAPAGQTPPSPQPVLSDAAPAAPGDTGPGTSRTPAPATAREAPAPYDTRKYMTPDEIQRGMKGFGRTVMAGTEIDTFQFEVLSVLKNAFEPKQDVILIRCSGLGLEQSGIIEGMSGSPCYITGDTGQPRMIGAVAFGWALSKAPICGVQPITQMLPIPDVRDPASRPRTTQPARPPDSSPGAPGGAGRGLGELLARVHPDPISQGSRFSAFNDDIDRLRSPAPRAAASDRQLRPLALPVMVSGASASALAWMENRLDRLGLKLVASGAASATAKPPAGGAPIQPGSVLCVPLMTGDLGMEALGTCTEVIDDKVLGFGHSLFARGSVELPLATGMVHTVFPSMFSSFKIGATLRTVGTLWGDEQTGVFGTCGRTPPMAPHTVAIHDLRGDRVYHYRIARERTIAPFLLAVGVTAGTLAHNELPDDHTVRYDIRIEFEGRGTYRNCNLSSLVGLAGLVEDLMIPALAMSGSPFGDAPVAEAAVDVTIEPVARFAHLDRLQLPRLVYGPGETVPVRIRWRHDRRDQIYSEAEYSFTLPSDIEDGDYTLTAASAMAHVMALRQEKPHLWRADNLADVLAGLNLAASFPANRLYLRLTLPKGGMAVGRTEWPELPSFRQQILLDARRGDVAAYSETLVVPVETDFVVNGSQSVALKVSRKTEY